MKFWPPIWYAEVVGLALNAPVEIMEEDAYRVDFIHTGIVVVGVRERVL
jgi:hypothetical protein